MTTMMTTTARPRFRTDLVAEPIEEGGHRYIDVVDPDTGNGFRFFEVEYSLACAMDGERDMAGLVQWAKEDLGIEPSTKELATVISTLGELGYLDSGAAAAAPGASDGSDLGLTPGVVAAPHAAYDGPREDIELGHHEKVTTRMDPLPKADFELGMAGGTAAPRPAPIAGFDGGPELGAAGVGAGNRELVMEFEAPTPPPAELASPKLRPVSRPDAEDDGPTNLPRPATDAEFGDDEVSVDLSDHLAISASDVKEAVRASKSMKAVDLPPELAAELDDSPEAREARLQAARETAEKAQAERLAAERAAAEKLAAERVAAEAAARPAVELPRPPVGVTRPKSTSERPVSADKPAETAPTATAKEAPAPRSGVSLWLVALLLLVVAAAGGWYYWTKVLKKPLPWESAAPAEGTTGTTGATGGTATEPPPPPPPPAPPSAALAEVPGAPTEVTAGQVGIVASAAEDGATVAAGDEIVRFKGSSAKEQKLVGLDYDIDKRVPKQLADAQKKKTDAAAAGRPTKQYEDFISERTKRLEQKVAERDALRLEMESLIVKAPVGGVVAMQIATGQRTAADQVIATVTPAPVLTATFTLPAGYAGKVPAVDASVRVAVKATPATKANCTATAVAAPTVTVVCPHDAGIAPGTEVVLE